jgi:hypothetical protein
MTQAGLSLKSGFYHLDWTLRFTHPTVIIDGHSEEGVWGECFFSLDPGPHEIEIFYRYLGGRGGRVCAEIEVAPNRVVSATYRAPNSVLTAFRPGKLKVEQPASG